jgi:hypothetical protein
MRGGNRTAMPRILKLKQVASSRLKQCDRVDDGVLPLKGLGLSRLGGRFAPAGLRIEAHSVFESKSRRWAERRKKRAVKEQPTFD